MAQPIGRQPSSEKKRSGFELVLGAAIYSDSPSSEKKRSGFELVLGAAYWATAIQ